MRCGAAITAFVRSPGFILAAFLMLAVTGLPPAAESTSVTADASIFAVITHYPSIINLPEGSVCLSSALISSSTSGGLVVLSV